MNGNLDQNSNGSQTNQTKIPAKNFGSSKKLFIALVILTALISVIWYLSISLSNKWSGNREPTPASRKLQTSSSTAQFIKDETANWKTYTDSKDGIVFKYPSNWYTQPNPEGIFVFLDNHPFEILGGTGFMTPIQIGFNEAENTTTNKNFL